MTYVKREGGFPGGEDRLLEQPREASLYSAGYGHLFERDSNRVMPSSNASSRAYEPAFIETDFTSPLTRDDRHRHVSSAPPSLPLQRLQTSAMKQQQQRSQTLPVSRMTANLQQNLYPSRFGQGFVERGNTVSHSIGSPKDGLAWQSRRGTVSGVMSTSQRRPGDFSRHRTTDEVPQRFVGYRRGAHVQSRQELPAALQLMTNRTLSSRTLDHSNAQKQALYPDSRGARESTDLVNIPLPVLMHSVEQPAVKMESLSTYTDSNPNILGVPWGHVDIVDSSSVYASQIERSSTDDRWSNSETEKLRLPDSKSSKDASRAVDCSKNSTLGSTDTSCILKPVDDDMYDATDRCKSEHDPPKLQDPASVVGGDKSAGSSSSSQAGSGVSALPSDSVASKNECGAVKCGCDDQQQDCVHRRRNSTNCADAHSCMNALSLTAEGEYEEEREFVWDDYLEDTKALAAPPTSFKHVECSLQNGFEKGLKLEVANKVPGDTYWIASILMTCGQLLRLRPEGCNDGSADFWCDILSSEVHQLGWSKENSKVLCPSEELRQKFPSLDWETTLKNSTINARTPSLYMLDRRTGPLPIDQIKEGMFLEVQLEEQLNHVWVVKVIENVGGRLLLRYEALDSASDDFWLFYLHHRLHSIGWAKSRDLQYHPPSAVLTKLSDSDWSKYMEQNYEAFEKNHPPAEILEDQIKIEPHHFVEGWVLEAVHPKTLSAIYPALVKRVVNEYFFTVELILENCEEPVQMCCHAGSLNIFPVGWCTDNDIPLSSTGGTDFQWQKFLEKNPAEPASESAFKTVPDKELHGFEPGMKLEAVNPCQMGQVCVATITKVMDGVMWLCLDHNPSSASEYIVPVDTYDVFPIGWCESNNYPLKTPKIASNKRVPNVQSERHLEDEARNALYMQMKEADLRKSSGWCPKIYFNYRCFTGRYLSKGRIVLLPRSVGPGSVALVMTTVLSKLVSVAYKSSRVLRELQLKGKPNPSMHSQLLRAKYKGKSYSAIVEICTSSDQINDFCRDVCRRLECCPNLISTRSYEGHCPENCSRLVKGRHTYYFGQKKRKIGRPPGGHSNLDFSPKKPGRRRRHRKLLLTLRKKHGLVGRVNSPGHEEEEEDESNSTGSWKCLNENDEEESRDSRESVQRAGRKRRRTGATTEIQTRGLKLPKYSFERRTHKKVLHPIPVVPKNNEFENVPMQISVLKEELLKLDSNPLYWSVQEVVEYIKTTDCASIARLFKEQEIDGQSLLLLSLPTVQEHLEPKLGPAVKLCHQIERLKVTFYHQFAS